jgi:hypothetical protein
MPGQPKELDVGVGSGCSGCDRPVPPTPWPSGTPPDTATGPKPGNPKAGKPPLPKPALPSALCAGNAGILIGYGNAVELAVAALCAAEAAPAAPADFAWSSSPA